MRASRARATMRSERRHLALFFSSLITVTAFVAATAFTQSRLRSVDALSSTIETNAIPSIEYLSRVALRLTRLNQQVDDIASGGPHRDAVVASASQEIATIDHDISRYLKLAPLPGETALWSTLRDEVADSMQRVQRTLEAEHGGHVPTELERRALDDALDRALRSVLAALEFDVRKAEVMAADVRNVRATTLRMIVALDGGATVIALFGVLFARRAQRRHEQLQQVHASLLVDRVTELDRFSGRVAHDILSPLGAVAAGLGLLGRLCDAHARTYVDRSQRALQQVQQLVEGLLVFARSGARPDASSRCSAEAILTSIAVDCSEAAAQDNIELVVNVDAQVEVPCTPGVMASIINNLIRNAIKYMGARPVRRITVRAKPAGTMVRFEVEDTGPGIPTAAQRSIFEPFVRGRHETVSGTGLGLATVKRLVESHGGSVGVDSTPGTGSTFWVNLPRVERADGGATLTNS
jgi:signal transduction histidine kinase